MSEMSPFLAREASRSYQRLLPFLENTFAVQAADHPQDWQSFLERLEEQFPRLFNIYYQLYHTRYDFFYHLEDLIATAGRLWLERPSALKSLDSSRQANPAWFQSQCLVGGVCYVDLFAGNLKGIRQRIPYFKELGLTYLHLMPLFKAPEGENDGGYAVSSYREVNPALGTMEELTELASELQKEGISLVLDFIFNHTSDEHEWAKRAKAGDLDYQEFYRMFPDRRMPDAYEATLREIFPDEHPGAFTYRSDLNQWVWTTFHSYQWDLNYENPAVFNRMAEEMLRLANAGVDVLRLDAVAFIWKKLGTSCENLPEAHMLIQAFNAVARIAAPAMIFKSEAIVHPDDVMRYISPDECQISYNPLLMALLWNTLATRDVRLLTLSMAQRFKLLPQCAWVNYVRCHDDIGWTFSDEDAIQLNINGYDHRRFLNQFYAGRFPGSFARGLPFQSNLKTGDMRISGTCASLAGLEKALNEETTAEVALAVRRILLIHGVILTIGGIPLIYLGDEIGTLNDYSFQANPAKASDSRWVHRLEANANDYAQRNDPNSVPGSVYLELRQLIEMRKANPAFAGGKMEVMELDNPSVFGFVRSHGAGRVLVFANFSEHGQYIPAQFLRLYGLGYQFTNLRSGETLPYEDISLEPYDFLCCSLTKG
jgi:amylosucrase